MKNELENNPIKKCAKKHSRIKSGKEYNGIKIRKKYNRIKIRKYTKKSITYKNKIQIKEK